MGTQRQCSPRSTPTECAGYPGAKCNAGSLLVQFPNGNGTHSLTGDQSEDKKDGMQCKGRAGLLLQWLAVILMLLEKKLFGLYFHFYQITV